jgi:uncharacterized protein (TIGR02231 family)
MTACLLFGPLVNSQGAVAKEIEVKSVISAVIVHPDAATITREAVVDLPSGASTIMFKNLPFAMDPASLRVSGEANGRLLIGSVETRVTPAAAKQRDNAVETRLKALRGEREATQVTIDALAAKQAMITRFAQSGPEKLSPETRPLPPGEWGAAFETIGAALAKNGEGLRLANVKARELDEEIQALESGQGQVSGGHAGLGPAREASVFVEREQAGRARLVLAYLTSGAGWTPAYDARLDTGDKDRKPSLELNRRAMVTQRTGEDWIDVALSVSTVRAHRGAAAPEPQPQRLAFLDYPVPVAKGAVGGGFRRENMSSLDAAAPASGLEDKVAAPEPVQQQVAAMDAGAYQATFKVSGAVSAPGDGSAKSFVLSSRKLEPKLEIRAAPALDPTAYLEAHLVNDEEAPLLPGPLAVHRDGVYVGESRIALVAPGDAGDFGFGADDKVKITRVPVKRMENEPGWFGQTRTETRDFKTQVKNLHGFPIHVTIVDQVPFSENTAITVELLPQTTAPSEKQVADKRGVMAWTFDQQPGEAKDIRLAWRVKWPADRVVVTQPAPPPAR